MSKLIPLTQGKEAIVDDDMFEPLNIHKWCAHKQGSRYYAERGEWINGKIKMIFMHREILPNIPIIDHINGNGLDNRRENLRAVTDSQNMFNRGKFIKSSSKFKGVSWYKRQQKWMAYIGINKKFKYLGYFDSEVEAAKAYNEAAIKYFGEYARLNILP